MTKSLGAVALLVAAGGLSVFTQGQAPVHAPDGGTQTRLMSIMVPPLPNAPFSAMVNTEWTRYLETARRCFTRTAA